jgi:type IV pilus secretin PilQ/predicted competence protein
MKYTIRSHYVIIFAFVLAFSCSSKKDILNEQSATVTSQEKYADNGSNIQEGPKELTQNKINDIRISEDRGGIDVFINSDSKPNYTHFKLAKPDRIILDIPDIANEEPLKELSPDSGMISTIRSSLMSDKDLKYLRIEIVLKNEVVYSAQSNDNTIIVNIKNKPSHQSEETVTKESSSDSSLLVSAQNQNIGKSNLIKLQIKNAYPRFTSYKLANPARLVLELENVQNKMQSGAVNINENFLSKIRFGQKDKNLKIVFDMRGNEIPIYEIRQDAPYVIVALGPDALVSTANNKAPRDAQTAEGKPETEKLAEQLPAAEKNDPSSKNQTKGDEIYTGEKISLDFKDADLKNVLRLLGDIGAINMTIGEKVSGRVTLKLENIPCDEALDIVLINNGLDKTVTPQYTRIDTVEQIKKFNDDRALAKRSHEQAEDMIIKTFAISYAQATNLAAFIKQMNVLTPNRGSINFFDLTNKLTVSDIPLVIAKVQKIIEEQDIPTRQVMIESRVVQSAPSWVKDLGIAWGGTYQGHGNNAQIPIRGAAGGNSVVNLLGSANGAINIGYITDKYALDATLTALENEDKLKILSNPRLLTLDNKEASIKQGVQLPYLKLNENGVTSTEFKDAVLEMKVKPKITAANTIAISVDVKKDQKSAQTGAGNEPGIDVRQIKTELLVESGKTVVIGGIYETTKSKNIKKVPLFGDIPFIGRFLFTSVKEEDTLTEMLVFITVTVVESPNNVNIEAKDNKR